MKKTSRRFAALTLLGGGLVLLASCSEEDSVGYGDAGKQSDVGGPCSRVGDCKIILVCAGNGTCQKPGSPGTKAVGKGCATYEDCLRNLTCASGWGICVEPGTVAEGGDCKGNPQNCAKDLVCSGSGKCVKRGASGGLGQGATCTVDKDCASGMFCPSGKCVAWIYWEGAKCATITSPSSSDPFRAFFEVPRTGKAVTEFYRLPFPNDIRVKKGLVDVRSHPDPASSLILPYKGIVTNVLDAINQDVPGFGLNPTVILRFSHAYDWSTFTYAGLSPTVQFVNIDKKSKNYTKTVAFDVFGLYSRNKYICANSVRLRPKIGQPLEATTTYAVLLREGIKTPPEKDSSGNITKEGLKAAQDSDFKIMIGSSEPSNTDLKAAWKAYEPLRDYLTYVNASTSSVLSAAVFTTMDPHYRVSTFRSVIEQKGDTPTFSDMTLCNGSNKSPCDDGKEATHKCPLKADTAFHELQGTLVVPALQAGVRPYRTIADKGYIEYESDGTPKFSGKESLCYALTIPKGATMPADGWPVVIYAHGTGGNYRGFVGLGVAQRLSKIEDTTTTPASLTQFAVIGIDGAMHGPRRNTTTSPEELFFNISNPRASRDNIYQGAADKFQLMRLIKSLDLDAAKSPTKEAMKLDTKNIYFFGHSQGTIEGLPFLDYEPDVKGTVLSGAGGYTSGTLLSKTKPVNVYAITQLAVADPDPYLGATHPMISLFQLLFEETDSINYARSLAIEPPTGGSIKHIFLTKGVADHYTPSSTVDALAWTAKLRMVKQSAQRCGDGVCTGTETCQDCSSDCKSCITASTCGDGACDSSKKEDCRVCPKDCACFIPYALDTPPVQGNHVVSNVKYTSAIVEYSGDGTYDDHLVIHKVANAKSQSAYFLGSAVWDAQGLPTIPKAQP